jgi:hypothetical protein
MGIGHRLREADLVSCDAAGNEPRGLRGGLLPLAPMRMPPRAHRLRPDHLPTPFSAAQIRAGCPVGRTIRLREEAPGEPPTFRRISFVEVDADGGVQEFQATDADGHPSGEPSRRRSTWLALQEHASQPAVATNVGETKLELPFGTFACWWYVVAGHDAEVRFWFAKSLPGMPVQIEEWTGGALTGRTTMIASAVKD